jgi:hypothetical protein
VGPSVPKKDKKSNRKGKGKAKMVQEHMEGIATLELDGVSIFNVLDYDSDFLSSYCQ